MACWFAENSAMTKENVDYSGNKEGCMILHNLYGFKHVTQMVICILSMFKRETGGQVKLVARLLATATLWVRIQTSPKIQNGRHKQRSVQNINK